jgi:hypothetical protein
VLAFFASSAAACDNVPVSLAQAFDASTPTDVPMPTDTPAPTEAPTFAPQSGTPSAPQGKAPSRAAIAAGLAAVMKSAGLRGGVVTSNSGSALGLKLGKNTTQISVAPGTIVVLPTKNPATISDVQVGDRVLANVTHAGSNASATMVLDLPAGYTVSNVIVGAVQSNANGSLTLRAARGGTRAVSASDTTSVVTLTSNPATVGSVAALSRGNAVLVIGSGNTSSFDAQVIVVFAQNARNLLQRLGSKRLAAPTATPGP